MDYTVSAYVQGILDAVAGSPEVTSAVEFAKTDHPFSMEEHKQFIACEAPTFHEEARGALFAGKLREYGLEDVTADAYGNVYGWRRGAGNGPVLLVEAHMDTVFPFGSVREIIDENGEIHAPGATDNTRGMTVLLAVLRAMNASGIRTAGDIIFCGTSREEGMGSLGGMRDFLAHGPKVDASISVDGAGTEKVICEATGYRTYEIIFKGIGGHAYCDFGKFANPLHAAARAVAKIADFRVPEDPFTTFCVSNFHAGNDAGIHSIVPKASIKLNIRSDSQKVLDELTENVFAAVNEACEEETSRWGRDTITWESKIFCDVPAGKEDHHIPLVEAAVAASRRFTAPENASLIAIGRGGCVNGNMAIGAGIPCVTIGGGPNNCSVHSLKEYFPYAEGYRLVQDTLTLICTAAGLKGVTESLIGKR